VTAPRRVRWLLLPLAWVYGAAVRVRAWLYRAGWRRQRRLPGMVLSVGNLTVGGTGKTPMVIWLADQLARAGEPVGVLTRGYRSVLIAPADGSGTPRPVSDETLVLESHLGDRVRIGIGADRYRTGCALAAEGVRWFVLDDGFQHLALARDADLVLVDASDPFGGGVLLPAGRLREPPTALARADLIVITRSEGAPELEARLRRYSRAPIFYARTRLAGLLRLQPEPAQPATADDERRAFVAFCATGNPAAFFADLERWKFRTVGRVSFPDHFRFGPRQVRELEAFAAARGASALVCTEKDILNLAGLRFEQFPLFVCRIVMEPTEPAALWQAILGAIERRRGAGT